MHPSSHSFGIYWRTFIKAFADTKLFEISLNWNHLMFNTSTWWPPDLVTQKEYQFGLKELSNYIGSISVQRLGYKLDHLGLIPCRTRYFLFGNSLRHALERSHFPIPLLRRALSPWVKRPGNVAKHLHSHNVKFKNFWSYVSKVAGSIPGEIIGFFNWPNPSSRIMALESTHSLTEMSIRNFPGSKGRPARKADNLTAICEPIV
jgi:hypothetical protein